MLNQKDMQQYLRLSTGPYQFNPLDLSDMQTLAIVERNVRDFISSVKEKHYLQAASDIQIYYLYMEFADDGTRNSIPGIFRNIYEAGKLYFNSVDIDKIDGLCGAIKCLETIQALFVSPPSFISEGLEELRKIAHPVKLGAPRW